MLVLSCAVLRSLARVCAFFALGTLLLTMSPRPTCADTDGLVPPRKRIWHTTHPDPQKSATLRRLDALRESNQPDSIWAMTEALIVQARAENDSVFLLHLVARHGALLCGRGRTRDSEPFLLEALRLSEALADTQLMCPTLRWLSIASTTLRDPAKATEYCRRLLPLARAIGDRTHEGWAQVGLAWHEQTNGRAEKALDRWHAAAKCFQEAQEMQGLAWAFNGIAVVHYSRAAYDEALRYREQAAEVAQQILAAVDRVYTLSNLLNTLAVLEFALGDPGAAEEHFQQAYDLQRESGHLTAQITPGLNVAICQTHMGRYADASTLLRELVQLCEENNLQPFLGKVLVHYAATRRLMGRHHEAADLLRQALTGEKDFQTHNRIQMRVNLAMSLAAMDSIPQAIAILEEGRALLGESADAQVAIYLRTALGERLHHAGRHREALDHFRYVDRVSGNLGPTDERILALSLAACSYRALGFVDSAFITFARAADTWESDRQVPLDPEWREQRGNRARGLYAEIVSLYLEEPRDKPAADRIQAAYDQVQGFKTRTLMERMIGPGTDVQARLEDALPALPTLEHVQQEVLAPGELLLDAFVGDARGFIFAISRDVCHVVELPREDVLERKLRLLLHAVSTPGGGDEWVDEITLAEICSSLGQQLLGEVAEQIVRSDRILFSPDGVLNLLPLGALPGPDGSEPLSATHEIVRVPSATFLTWRRDTPTAPEADSARGVLAIASVQGPEGERLRGAREEVRHLARVYREVDARIVGADAETCAVADLLPHYQVLHFASHAYVDDQNPWRSTILLDPLDATRNPRADRISELRLPARMVVLSSCESARGRILSGEGVQGLTSAFLAAGVPAVVATLWQVDDRSTAKLMAHLYEALADGEAAAAALKAARESLRRDAPTSRPYYWAGFVLVGDGEIGIDLEPRPILYRYYHLLLASALVLAAVWAATLARRRRPPRNVENSKPL